MAVPPSGQVLVGVVVAGRLAGERVGVVEDLLEVLDGLSLLDRGGRHLPEVLVLLSVTKLGSLVRVVVPAGK